MRRTLFLATIAAPALLAAQAAADQTVGSSTTPVATATANAGAPDNLTISGTINVTGPVAAQLNSSNTLTNAGVVQIIGVDGSTAESVTGGFTGALIDGGQVINSETYVASDLNGDGVVDGVFAQGTGRVGIGLTGAGAFTGPITQTGSVNVQGNDSTGILIGAPLVGNLTTTTITILGSNSYGVRTTAPITGSISLQGPITATGEGVTGASIEAPVSGQLRVAGTIVATGYRLTSRPVGTVVNSGVFDPNEPVTQADAIIAKLRPDDLLQGGSALKISGNLGGGLFLYATPATIVAGADADADGIDDSLETTSTLSVLGGAPALKIGDSTAAAITLGEVGSGANAFGVVANGFIRAQGLFDGFATTAVRVENATIAGGIINNGTITSQSWDANATGLSFGAGAVVPSLYNLNTITANVTTDKTSGNAYGILIDPGATVSAFTNTGKLQASITGVADDIVVIRDQSDSLHTINNTGVIEAVHSVDPGLTITGSETAIDLSTQTIGTTITQTAPSSSTAPTPSIAGGILFGSGADTLSVLAGSVVGPVSFGAGADTLVVDNGATLRGAVTDSDGLLSVTVNSGKLDILDTAPLNLTSLTVGANGKLSLLLNPTAGASSTLNVAGGASFAAGSQISLRLLSTVPTATTFAAVTAGSLTGAAGVSFVNAPYLYTSTSAVTANAIDVTLTQKTPAEMGMNPNQASALGAILAGASNDPNVISPLLGTTTRASFLGAFNQFLPNATGAEGELALISGEQMSTVAFDRFLARDRNDRAIYLWTNETAYSVNRQTTANGQGFDGHGFNLSLGIDGPFLDHGFKGFGFSFGSNRFNVKTAHDSPIDTETVQVFAHAAHPVGPVLIGGWVGAAYDHYKSSRHVTFAADADSSVVDSIADADWSGEHVTAALKAALPLTVGPVLVRPEIGVDAIAMWENAYTESGAGAGIDLSVDKRDMVRAVGSTTVAFAWPVKRAAAGLLITPEVKVGARYRIIDDALTTTARFAGGTPFSLASDPLDKVGGLAGFSLTVAGAAGSFALEGQGEQYKDQLAVSGRMVARLTF
jgi:hypothetical protein